MMWAWVLLGLGGVVCWAADEQPYVVEEQGRSTWRAGWLDKKMPTSSEQWVYARKTQDKGHLKKAERRMLYLVRRWPNSQEAPWAQRARADMFYTQDKLKEAFKEYQYLIDNYSSRMHDYGSVLESQFVIAVDVMERKRMRWFFGGYRAPEYAVDYFEDVIRNGPQGKRAPESQFLIGQAYQQAKEFELAILAYGVLGYRYPDCPYAETAAWQQILCLEKLRKEYPNNLETLDRTLTATTVFLSTYPTSKHKNTTIQLRNVLYEVKAKKVFDEAEFYAKVPKKPEAALVYFERLIKEYPKSKRVPEAHKRMAEIRELMATPRVAPPISESKEPPSLNMEKELDHAGK